MHSKPVVMQIMHVMHKPSNWMVSREAASAMPITRSSDLRGASLFQFSVRPSILPPAAQALAAQSLTPKATASQDTSVWEVREALGSPRAKPAPVVNSDA